MPVLTQWHGGVLGLALLVLVGVVDVWATPTRLVRKWSKPTWWTVVLIPGIGLLTWVTMGRPRGNAGARGGRGRPGLTVIEGGATPGSLPGLAVREQTNLEIERSKELNKRLAEWEAEHDRRRKPNLPPAQPSADPPAAADADADPRLAEPIAADLPQESAEEPSSGATPANRSAEQSRGEGATPRRGGVEPSSVSEELSDEELAATIEKWRAELDK